MQSKRDPGRWARLRIFCACLASSLLLAACGGGDDSNPGGGTTNPPASGDIAYCDSTDFQKVLFAIPAAGGSGGGTPAAGSVRIHYNRPDGNYSGWQTYVYNAPGEALGGWPGKSPTGNDSYGAYWDVPVTADAFNFILHNGDSNREPSGWSGKTGTDEQQYWKVADGKEIWKVAGDKVNYTSNPLSGAAKDIATVRVHYKRFDAQYGGWGLHLWSSNGMDASRLPAGVVIENWNSPVPFAKMPGYSLGSSEVVFDIPVLNPKQDATRKSLEFIIHGLGGAGQPGNDDKDGRNDNVKVNFAALNVVNQVGEVWLLQQDATVYAAAPDTRSVSSVDAQAYWLSKQLLQWPKVDTGGVFKLYYSANGQIKVSKDVAASGADGSITLELGGSVPSDVATRFKFVAPGVVLKVKDADLARLADLHVNQLVLVQESADGKVQNATTAQLAGALDDQFSAARAVADLGASVAGGSSNLKLWAPTAQKVQACVYDTGSGKASSIEAMTRDAASGVWRLAKSGDLSGKYYTYLVDVFVRGVGVVRNRVTDPYSISLTTDSKRSYLANLDAASLKPSGWDASNGPNLAAQEDMSIYELHVRDFSVNDSTVSPANRGKYLAFTEEGANGMKHLKALAAAGLTDIHLLPVFDLATVPESGCKNPTIPNAAADAEDQQAAVAAVKDEDCFNWGYDPYHYTAPEGSYASDAADGAKRVVEFRQMVMALHKAGLRVGMDVVYNHTSASGQDAKSVLDRIVPGYYQRLNGTGGVETSTCCANTATENLMMGKLMIDSVKTWVTQYKIDSFRFDLMAHQPRKVMEDLKVAVNAAAGRDVLLVGEGWNFGEVANGARFEQASQLSLNGSGIGTFSDRARDAVRGGGPFDGGNDLVRNQGYISGLFYDDNGSGAGKTRNDLLAAGDMVKVGLAGSLRDYPLNTYQDTVRKLSEIDYGGQPAGYVSDPQEVVNYVENHDNQTLFDINAYKLPLATSKAERARVQMLGAAINSFSQGVAYFHAGIDTLRSKSMDRNSYNSGDWFNRLDWSYADNYFGTGAPNKTDNGDNYSVLKPLLANTGIKPGGSEIAYARDAFRDLLAIRKSSTLFRLRAASDVKQRLVFYNTGSAQVASVIAGHLDGQGYGGAGFSDVLYFVNVDKVDQTITIAAEAGKPYVLHPVQSSASAADPRVRAAAATVCGSSGSFKIPARSAVVCIVP
ncbi:alpha-1,6-glucosidase domain-containing protein [Chitinimonas naiadis]